MLAAQIYTGGAAKKVWLNFSRWSADHLSKRFSRNAFLGWVDACGETENWVRRAFVGVIVRGGETGKGLVGAERGLAVKSTRASATSWRDSKDGAPKISRRH